MSQHEANGWPTCWACGRTCNVKHLKRDGWQVRPFLSRVKEVYCPDCFARWGWGDDLTNRVGVPGMGVPASQPIPRTSEVPRDR